jgi:uncharacterized membrane protein required for colicin V production
VSLDKLPINRFDCLLFALLVAGIIRGRKQGMSEELLSLLGWISLVGACAMGYEPLGRFYSQTTSLFSLTTCYVMAYITLALGVLAVFFLIKRGLGGKLLGSDVFGQTEYYLGMGSGFIRFACMLLAGLALLNAKYYSPAEIKRMEKYQNDEYGSTYFPTLASVQTSVFDTSLTGPLIKNHLDFLLIKRTESKGKQLRQREFTMP